MPSATSVPTPQEGGPGPMLSLWATLFSVAAIRDGAKLFVLGGAIEAARRLLSALWTRFIGAFFLTAEFEERDDTFSECSLENTFVCRSNKHYGQFG